MNNAPRKFISIFLVVLMLASMLPTTVFAATAPKVTAASVEKEMIAGQTVDVDIMLSDNPGITGGQVKIEFEKAKLKLTSVKNTNQTITSTYNGYSVMPITSGSYTLSWDGDLLSADLTGNGVIATLTFEVLDAATVGDSTITVSYVDFVNADADSVAGTGVNGKVTLYSKLTGDLPVTIAKPVKGDTPQGSIAATTQYTGTIAWEGSPSTFTANTKYTAKVELTANTGYQFADGVNPTVAGSDSVTDVNVKDSGSKLEFNAIFPKTGAATLKGIDIITNPELKLAVPTAAPNATATNERSLAVTGVYDDGSFGPVAVTWEITTDPIPKGVSLDGSTLKVTNEAEAGKVRVLATSAEGKTDAELVTITKDTSVESAIVLTPPSSTTVAVPKSDTPNKIDLPTAAVYDQYGKPMTGTPAITYKIVSGTSTGVTLAPGYGEIEVDRTAQAGEVKIVAKLGTTLTSDPVAYTITRETSQVTSVSVSKTHYFKDVPEVTELGTPRHGYHQFDAAKVLDQYGQEMTGQTVIWNVADDAGNPVTGVSIDNSGKLTVTNEAPAITVYVTATCSGIVSNRTEMTLSKDPSKDTFVKICNQVGEGPETSLPIPTGSIPRSEDYTAKVYDQYGKETAGMVYWALNPTTVTGVTLDDVSIPGSATLKVDNTATPGTIKLIATCSTVGSTAKKELDITLANKTPATVTIAPTAKTDLKYNGDEQALLTEGTASGGTMQYSLGSSPWSTTIPTAKDAATYTVQYKVVGDGTHADTTPVNLEVTIAPKTLTKDDLTPTGSTTKVYDGTTNSSITVGVKASSLCGSDTLAITGSAVYNSADVNEADTITFTPNAISTGNYTLAATETLTITDASISLRDLIVTPNGGQSKAFGNADPTLTYAYSGEVSGETPAFTGKLSRETGENAGSYKILQGNLALKDNGAFKAANYTLKWNGTTPAVTFAINKIAPTNPTGLTGVKGQALSTVTLPANWNWDAPNTVMAASGSQTFAASFSGDTNHMAVSNVSLTVNVQAKTDVSGSITFPNGTLTYNGNAQTYEKATISGVSGGTWNYTYVANSGTGASLDSAGLPLTAGTYTVTAKYEDDANIGTKNATLTISKATPTGAPKYTAITTSGKTLADAGLTTTGSTLNPNAGTLVWVDNAGNVLPGTTAVAANTTYKWLFTPTDTNYTTLTGTITPYVVSYSGGGGGSYTSGYTITVDSVKHGTITVSPKSASKGDTVTITVKPDKGYELEMLKALDKDGDALKLTEKNGKYTFKMPSGKVTVKGSFVEEAPEQIFKDVPVDAYYYEAVKWAAEKGITGGVGNGLFAPNQPCTRAQIVTFLWRAAGSPAPKNMSSFTDVPADAFYAKAVAWAVENGITGGTGDGKFSPDATCTRAQSVTFLYRAAGSPKVSSSAEFGDVATNAYYADAVAWAAKNGITGGIGGGLFGSDNDCTRAQIVTFLYRSVK